MASRSKTITFNNCHESINWCSSNIPSPLQLIVIKIILTIKGYVNSKEIKMDESELVEEIKKIASNGCAELPKFEFKDIQTILEDELFKKLLDKLEQANYDEGKKSQMRDIAIKAMSEARV